VDHALVQAPPSLSPPHLTELAPATHLTHHLRLANTTKSVDELARKDHAILLENALLDTDQPLNLSFPEALRSQGETCGYIVQSRAPLDPAFRGRLERLGVSIVSYIPNNACLVVATAAAAQQLQADPQTQAVLPYEPYYKLKPSLLAVALSEFEDAESSTSDLPPLVAINLLLFPNPRPATLSALTDLGAQILSEDSSPFGPVLKLTLPITNLASVARLPETQELEFSRARQPANDLSRVTLGIAPDPRAATNYLGLTGSNILVNINDTGVDANHPDLLGRVLFDVALGGMDTNGHGTHVAGIIAASGASSLTVTNAPGSSLPPANFQFRGKAPGAVIFSLAVNPASGSPVTDLYLQQTAARTNVFISNNSWHYAGDNDYDLAAASYDAAVRDALAFVPGPQPLLFVFGAGNSGGGAENGTGGLPDTIQSPATAKNVLTVGAIEQARYITNQTWSCSASTCTTNTPWLGLTDATNQVASFSSRGNVGPGLEGDFGRFKPDLVAPGTMIVSTRSTQWNQSAYYSRAKDPFTASFDTNHFQVLSNLNWCLGPFYRFECGTSLAAAEVSGTLVLMQEFFQMRLGRTNSPALMKALLINGARPLANASNFQVQAGTNFQGWGLLNLPNSLPGGLTNLNSSSNSMFIFDQNPAQALATGQSQTRLLALAPAATSLPLRLTLVWTDPPGNPIAGLKLVNDLDLVVTNLDTGDVFFGNDIAAGTAFNNPWNPAGSSKPDCVNNVENVFLAPPLGANYSVTVLGRRVNVNAVTAVTNDVVQDYALVIASGDGQIPNAITLSEQPIVASAAPLPTTITNSFTLSGNDFGAVLLHQRAGANAPYPATNTIALAGITNAVLTIGATNQWHFYTFNNATAFTNAAFLTFAPLGQASLFSPLAYTNTASNSVVREPDLDLYVSRDPGLTNLSPVAIANADMSLGRGGSEAIIYSNATPGLYYIGVKCESQEAADFGFAALCSSLPFSQVDPLGNLLLRGSPAPTAIPAGAPADPGVAWVFALNPSPGAVRRVIVTNSLSTPALSSLQGALTHNNTAVVLDNHSPGGPALDQSFVYDDTTEGDIPGAQPTDGPGSLRDFAGQSAFGQWQLTLANTNLAGTNDSLWLSLEPQGDLTTGVFPNILPGACHEEFISLLPSVTNLAILASLNSGTGPLSLQVFPSTLPSTNFPTTMLTSPNFSGAVTLDKSSLPPLYPTLYAVRLCNLGPDPALMSLSATLTLDPNPPIPVRYTSTAPLAILDDALTATSLLVTNTDQVVATEVGVQLNHPRVSDLALTLVSPNGTRVLLDENRGGASSEGMGSSMLTTNTIPVSSSGGAAASTNIFDTGQTAGTLHIVWNMYSLPDEMHVYYQNQLIFDSGLVSGSNFANVDFGPGTSTFVAIIMNEGGNFDTNTAWFYTVTSTRIFPVYFTFTEDTNLTVTPVKFAPPPFTNVTYAPSNGIYYLPEESLTKFNGQPALGPWTLEIQDRRAGATNPVPVLQSWTLALLLRNPVPVPLSLAAAMPATNLLGPGQLQWFSVNVPGWGSFATNSLLFASAPVNLFFNANAPPSGTNAGDFTLLANTTAGAALLQTNGVPPLTPGARYFLGVQNTSATTVSFALQLDFDVENVITLQDGVPFANTNSGPLNSTDYYRYVVASNTVRAQFEIDNPTAALTLVARKGVPLPSLNRYDYLSANPGTNDELIVVYSYSSPVPLTPGEWYLAAVNVSGLPAAYSILATGFPIYGTNLVITAFSLATNSLCLTWSSLPGVYYCVQGTTSCNNTNWVTVSPTLTANDYATGWCVPLPSPFHFFRIREGIGLVPVPISISNIVRSANGVLLQWNAPANNQFTVQWTASLASPSWTTLPNLIVSATGLFSFLDDGSQTGGLGPTRFYRLQQWSSR
jgi:subtilisin-like proprotein convertase family protein